MRIAIGSDEIGFPLKSPVITALESEGHVVLDLGSFSTEPVDYPDYARVVAQAVLRGFVDTGVLLCASGVGASIAANKLRGVRAAFCPDSATATQSREQENANVLCLSASTLDAKLMLELCRAWLGAHFTGREADARRVAKIARLEEEPSSAERPHETLRAAQTRADPAADRRSHEAAAVTEPHADIVEPSRVSVAISSPVDPADVTTNATSVSATAVPEWQTRDVLRAPLVEETLQFLDSQSFLDRLWTKDPSLWKGDPEIVRNRLGWLTAPTIMRAHAEDLRTFADEIRRLQFSQIVVLGMGGSTLSTEVFSQTFRSRMGFPDLVLLDSTDPATVQHTLDRITVPRTLFLVSSKSGTTAETLAFHAFFRAQVEKTAPPKPGMQFVAITDPGTPLDAMARETGFRHAFLNPSSIGGRFSALSFFGLLPAALIGVDIKSLLERARAMVDLSGGTSSVHDSPAVRLGAALGALAKLGRDKITFVISDKIRTLGPWLEQLLAESLGKDGKGLVPVVDEPLGNPVVYGSDRVFVAVTLEDDRSHDAALATIAAAEHPLIRITVKDPLDLGAEFFRWELATATAGAILGVNPFDEPDVARAKDNTATLLAQWSKTRQLPEWPADAEEPAIVLMAKSSTPPPSVAEGLTAHLALAQEGDYLAILSYLEPTDEIRTLLQAIRTLLRDRLKIATTLGFGPRYLHSTGQLHKGGPPNGLFVQITGDATNEVPIPGAAYDFSTFNAAQALGDLQALHQAGRRVVRLHLRGAAGPALQQLLQMVRGATRRL